VKLGTFHSYEWNRNVHSHPYCRTSTTSIIIIIIIRPTVFKTPCRRRLDGGLVVTVAGAGGTVTAVVAVPTDKIPGIAVLAVALITSSWPRLGHVRTERGQDDDDHDDRRGQQTYPTMAEVVTTGRRSHVSQQTSSTIDRCFAGVLNLTLAVDTTDVGLDSCAKTLQSGPNRGRSLIIVPKKSRFSVIRSTRVVLNEQLFCSELLLSSAQ